MNAFQTAAKKKFRKRLFLNRVGLTLELELQHVKQCKLGTLKHFDRHDRIT
jgi:hypothetical protein